MTRRVHASSQTPNGGRGRRLAVLALKEMVKAVVVAAIASVLLRAFVGQVFYIPSASMENTLLEGDRVVVQKLVTFRRGDIVTFQDPGD